MIQASNIHKSFGRLAVLKGVTLSVEVGQVIIYAINFDTMRVLTLVSVLYLVVFFTADRLGAFLEVKLAR